MNNPKEILIKLNGELDTDIYFDGEKQSFKEFCLKVDPIGITQFSITKLPAFESTDESKSESIIEHINALERKIADLELALKDGNEHEITNTFVNTEMSPSEMRTLVQKIKDDIRND